MPGTRLQRLRQRAMDANSRAARRTFPTAAREVRFQIRSVHPSSEDGVTGLALEVVAVTRGRLAATSYVDRSDQAMAEDTRHRGDHGTTAPGSRASGSATTMAGVGAVPGRWRHGHHGVLPGPGGLAAAGLDAEAGAVPGPELLGRSRDPGRRATAPAPPAKAVVLTGGEPVRLRQRRRHLLRRARRAPPGAVPRAGGPALPVPLPDPDGRAAAAGAPADSEGGPGQPDRRLRDCPGRGPAELAVPDRPAGERRPALRAGQDGLRR